MNIFEITIQRKSKDNWPIIVECSQPGVLLPLRHESTLQFSQTDLEELQSLLGQPESYGTFLGKRVFQNEVRDAFISACKESPDGLRILLFIEAECTELRTLRWERLCAPKDGQWDFLRLDQRLPFSLYIPASTDRRFPPIGKRDLRALVVAASPENLGKYRLDAFDVKGSVDGVRKALGKIHCDVLALTDDAIGPPTLDELCRQLTDRTKQYTLLHFISHGKVLKDGDTALYWADANNHAEVVTGTKLIKEMGRLRGARGLPHFAFLSTCESASSEAGMGGLGQRLVRNLGMPAVIAMTETITIKTALTLGQRFYQQLRESGHVDSALDEATAGLTGRMDIIVPALFSRLASQPLFSDSLDRNLTNKEIEFGLNRLQNLLPERAPILQEVFEQVDATLRTTLGSEIGSLSTDAQQERKQALEKVNEFCGEILDLSFNALALDKQPPIYDSRCPFQGLYAFHADSKEFFFGREQLIEKLEQKLLKHPFLAVLGSSGSGKSSIVFAGLVPKLQSQEPKLNMISFTPGAEPLAELEAAKVADKLTIFVIDQFEELFTLCNEEEQRQQFIAAMLALSQQQRVIITMRADFWGECASYENLKDEMEAWQVLIGPMNTVELRKSMESQARKVGLRFDINLSNTLLDEIKEEPGAMPLLQHALQELWKRRHGQWLKAEEYHDGIGGVKKSIAKTADEVYEHLNPAEQIQFKNVFIRLTRLDDGSGEGGRDTRRRVDLEELVLDGELVSIKALVSRLANARLVVTNQNQVEVAHEALIRYWPRLANWLNENRANLQLRETIRQSALKWEENQKQDDDLVLKGGRLDDASGLARQEGFLNKLEAGYVRACVVLAEAAEKAIARRRRITFASLTVGLIIAVVLAGFAFIQMNVAETQRQEAEASEKKAKKQAKIALIEKLGAQSIVATESPSTSNGSYEHATLLATQAFNEKDIGSSRRNLLRVLQAKKHKKIFLYGHSYPVTSVAFSPDGNLLASASDDKTVRLWDVKKQQPFGDPLTGHSEFVKSVAFSPDGNILASASFDKTVRLWDVQSRKPLGDPLTGHSEFVNSVAFSPDGYILASASGDKTVRLWDVQSRKPLSEPLTGHSYWVLSVTFSPDGNILASGGDDRTVRLWDVQSRKPLGEPLTGHLHEVNSLAFSPDGNILASADADVGYTDPDSTTKTIRLWDVKRRIPLGEPLTKHSYDVTSLAFSPDGNILASASSDISPLENADYTVRLWDVKQQKLLSEPLTGHSSHVNGVAFSPDGNILASASSDNTVRLWDVKRQMPLLHSSFDNSIIAFSPDGNILASASSDNTVRFWNVQSHKPLGDPLTGHSSRVNHVVFNPDGNILASASSDRTVRLWDVQSRKLLGNPLTGHSDSVWKVIFSPDGNILASASSDRTVRLWDVEQQQPYGEPLTGLVTFSPDGNFLALESRDKTVQLWDVKQQKPLGEPFMNVTSVAFSPNGNLLALASRNKTVRLWDVKQQQLLGKPFVHSDSVWEVAFSPDGNILASASDDKTVRLWDVQSRKPLGEPLTGPLSSVDIIAFSPDGNILVLTGAEDRSFHLWDVKQQIPFSEPFRQFIHISSVAFSPNSNILASTGYKTVYLWDLNPNSWKKQVCAIANRNLSHKEWRKYISDDRPHEKTCPDLPTDTLGAIELTKEAIELVAEAKELEKDNPEEAKAKLAQAKEKFAKAREWDVNMVYGDAQILAELIEQGQKLAKNGKIEAAIAKFKEAQTLDLNLNFDPKIKAKQTFASIIIEEGEELARNGKIEAAIAKFKEVQTLDLNLNFEPEIKAKQTFVWILIEEGEELARNGKIEAAIAKFEEAQTFDSNFTPVPETKAKQLFSQALYERIIKSVEREDIEAAIIELKKAQQIGVDLEISVDVWDTLCSGGIQNEYAAKVIESCEQAVTLAPENEYIRDNRARARVLTGNIQGAIEDYQFVIEKFDDEALKKERQDWITALQKRRKSKEDIESKPVYYDGIPRMNFDEIDNEQNEEEF